ARERLARVGEDRLGRPRADRQRYDVRVEDQLLRLRRDRLGDLRMAMARRADGVAAVEVEVAPAALVPHGRALPAHQRDPPARVGRKLRRNDGAHGKTPDIFRPAVSGSENMMFMAWMACPAAPLTRLSIATKTLAVRPATATPMSAKFVPLTAATS